MTTICVKCKSTESRVTDSRPKGDTIWRRRTCQSCGHRWSTYEVDVEDYKAARALTGSNAKNYMQLKKQLFGVKATLSVPELRNLIEEEL